MAAAGLSIYPLSYLTMWVSTEVNQVLAATDLPAHALSVGVMSQLVIPVLLLLPMSAWGVDGVWWSMVLGYLVSALFSAAMLLFGVRRGIFERTRPPSDRDASRSPRHTHL